MPLTLWHKAVPKHFKGLTFDRLIAASKQSRREPGNSARGMRGQRADMESPNGSRHCQPQQGICFHQDAALCCKVSGTVVTNRRADCQPALQGFKTTSSAADPSAVQRDYAPRARTCFDLLSNSVGRNIHHGNVIRRTVRRIQRLAIRRKRNTPGTRPYLDRPHHLVRGRIDREHLMAPARAYIESRRIRREQYRHRFDDTRLAQGDRSGHLLFHGIDDDNGPVIFGIDVGSGAIGQEATERGLWPTLKVFRILPATGSSTPIVPVSSEVT
jgi:hypothetical protein